MGYAGSDLNLLGGTMTASQFMNVGAKNGEIKLKELVPTADPSTYIGYSIGLQFLNFDGSTDSANDFLWDGEKWVYIADFQDASNLEIPGGKGLWAINNSGGFAVSFQSAGEVNVKDILYPLNLLGGSAVANCFPTPLTLGDFVPVADDESTYIGYSIGLQFLNYDGSTDSANDFLWDGEKWVFIADFQDASSVAIPAAKGIWAINNSGGFAVSLQVPAPEL